MAGIVVAIVLVLAVVVVAGTMGYMCDVSEKLRYARQDANGWERNYREGLESQNRAIDARIEAERQLSDTVLRLLELESDMQDVEAELQVWKLKCQQLIDEITNSKPKPLTQQQFEFMSREPVEL
jgi:hypothetical protein